MKRPRMERLRMTGPKMKRPKMKGPGTWGLLARFASPKDLLRAAGAIREAGYRHCEGHSPFPIHGLDELLGHPESKVGRPVLAGALAGAVAGMAFQSWASSIAYPLLVSGKPFFSWPAFVPISFELAILGGALGAVGGLLWLTGLPQLHHPLFASASFEAASDDGFFLTVESTDPLFEEMVTSALLKELGASEVERIATGSDGDE